MIRIAVSPAAFEAAARKIAVILLAISTLSTGATSQVRELCKDVGFGSAEGTAVRFKHFSEASKAVRRLTDQQFAKCEMDAQQYIDEHSSGMTVDEVKAHLADKYVERVELCMEAAGYAWPGHHTAREIVEDSYRRMRELWVAAGRSQSDLDWFDRYVACLQSKG